MFKETKLNPVIFQLDFWAAALLVYWCNIFSFLNNTHFIYIFFNIVAYVATVSVVICGYKSYHFNYIGLILAVLLIVAVSLLLPAGSTYLSPYLFTFLVVGIIGVLIASIIREPKYILFWWFAFYLVLSLSGLNTYLTHYMSYIGNEYYMTTSYLIFFLFVFLVLLAVNKIKWYYVVGISLCSLAIIEIGTRGVIVAVFLTFLTVIMIYKPINSKRILLGCVLLGVILLAGYLLVFTPEGLALMKDLMNTLGISSRMVWLIEENRITTDVARSAIYQALINGALQSPILGYGLCGDRYITYKTLGIVYYAHDFFLEMIVDFGAIGIFLLMLLFWLFKKSAMETNDADWKIVGYLFFICCFYPKIFSGTILHPMTLPTIAILLKIKANNSKLFAETS